MAKLSIYRRMFLRQSSTGATALGTTVLLAGKSQGTRVAKGPNNQISIGIISAGDRGQAQLRQIRAVANTHNVKVTAICDIWKVNRKQTSAWVADEFGSRPEQFSHFGDLLALDDIEPIPGSNKVVASFSPGHGRAEHMGHITIVDPSAGPDVQTTVRQVSKADEMFRDPYAISDACFLVANDHGILVMDGEGNTELVYEPPEEDRAMECHEPRLLSARPREAVIPTRANLIDDTGKVVLADIYHGRSMKGIERGEIKKLLVLEQLPKPVNFSGGQDPLSIGGTFTMARILGTVPHSLISNAKLSGSGLKPSLPRANNSSKANV